MSTGKNAISERNEAILQVIKDSLSLYRLAYGSIHRESLITPGPTNIDGRKIKLYFIMDTSVREQAKLRPADRKKVDASDFANRRAEVVKHINAILCRDGLDAHVTMGVSLREPKRPGPLHAFKPKSIFVENGYLPFQTDKVPSTPPAAATPPAAVKDSAQADIARLRALFVNARNIEHVELAKVMLTGLRKSLDKACSELSKSLNEVGVTDVIDEAATLIAEIDEKLAKLKKLLKESK